MNKHLIRFSIFFSLLFGVLAGSSQVHAQFNDRDWTSSRAFNRRWMTELKDDVRLSQLSIPGTHNSGTSRIPSHYARTQSTTIQRQLNNGHRFLDIRVRAIDGVFTVHHGAYYARFNFGDVLNWSRDFLRSNPGEVIYMRLKQEHSSESDAVFNRILNDRYLNNPQWSNLFYYANGNNNPTLGQTRGKIVIFRNFLGNNVGIPYPAAFDIQDYWDPWDARDKQWAIYQQMVKARDSRGENNTTYINFTSAWHWFFQPIGLANRLNPEVLTMFRRNVGHTGIVATDFAGEQLVDKIIDANQRHLKDPTSRGQFHSYVGGLQSRINPSRVLDWNQRNNEAIVFPNRGDSNQGWHFEHQRGTNTYLIRSQANQNFVLSETPNNNVVVSTNISASSRWEIVEEGSWHTNGKVVYLRNAASGRVLDIEGSNMNNGNLITHPLNRGNNQKFILFLWSRR
ncbi:Phosphatidylinositol-specific phospholipase C, X domain protein [Enterococcus faecalis 13-SD-W-01]|nr:Phosphatidylinositol-specific phospholipase C, X domain protein [Enterococcus faecalis 13-SD-W-01]